MSGAGAGPGEAAGEGVFPKGAQAERRWEGKAAWETRRAGAEPRAALSLRKDQLLGPQLPTHTLGLR